MKTRKLKALIIACIMFCLVSALTISTNAEKIEIRDGTTSIEDRAFYNRTDITSIVIPDSVTSIGNEAFSGCYNLTSIVIPDSVTTISDFAFADCFNLTSIDLPSNMTSIGEFAFSGCDRLRSVVIPDGITSINDFTFSGCSSLTSIIISDNVTSIGYGAFYNCALKSIVIPGSVTSFGDEVFINVYIDQIPTVCGFAGTTAESYAKANDFPFVDISIATPTSAKVLINGKEVSFTAYNIDGNNYFKLRDVAMAINGTEKNFDVIWNKELNSIELISNQAYTAVGGELVVDSLAAPTKPVVTNSTVYIYGFPAGFTAFNIKNNNYFKLRDIGKAFDFGIGWDNATKTITIDTSAAYTE